MRQLSRFHVAISRDASTRVLGEPILGNSIQTSHHGVRVYIISVIRTVFVAHLQTRRLVLTPLLSSFRSRRERFLLDDARFI